MGNVTFLIERKNPLFRLRISFGSIKRFEQTGEISLTSLTKIAIALKAEDEMDRLFSDVPFESIEEVLNEQA